MAFDGDLKRLKVIYDRFPEAERLPSQLWQMVVATFSFADLIPSLLESLYTAVEGYITSGFPFPPIFLEATTVESDSVVLEWRKALDSDLTGHKIYRSDDGGETWGDPIDVVGATTETYTDDTVAAETDYTYKITGYNATGESQNAEPIAVTTPAAE